MSAKDEKQENGKPCDEKEVEEEEEEEEGEVENIDDIFGKPKKSIGIPSKGSTIEDQQKKMEELDKITKQREHEELKERNYNTLKTRYNPQTSAAEIILKDYVSCKTSQTKDSAFKVNMINDDLFHWEVNVDTRKLNPETEFYKDAVKYNVSEVIFRIIFPPNYPADPPYVYVNTPRFVQHTGRVTIEGSLCLDLLTKEGWMPTININGLINTILNEMFTETETNIARIDPCNRAPYSLEASIAAFENIARQHNWQIPPWIYEIKKKNYQ